MAWRSVPSAWQGGWVLGVLYEGEGGVYRLCPFAKDVERCRVLKSSTQVSVKHWCFFCALYASDVQGGRLPG